MHQLTGSRVNDLLPQLLCKYITLRYQKRKRYIPFIHLGHDSQMSCNSVEFTTGRHYLNYQFSDKINIMLNKH